MNAILPAAFATRVAADKEAAIKAWLMRPIRCTSVHGNNTTYSNRSNYSNSNSNYRNNNYYYSNHSNYSNNNYYSNNNNYGNNNKYNNNNNNYKFIEFKIIDITQWKSQKSIYLSHK